jgi:hypothetical protein
MVRALTAGFIAEAVAASNRPIMLFEGVFASSTLRLWNGYGDLSWNSQTWLGNGWFRGIEGGEETTQVEALDMAVILSGVSASAISLVLGDQKQGAGGNLYIGFLNSSGAVVADPYLWWAGGYSHTEIAEAGDSTTLRLTYESRLVDMDRPREGRWTHDSQQQLFAGDKGFEYVVATANWHGQWGGKKEKPTKGGKKKSGGSKGSAKRN